MRTNSLTKSVSITLIILSTLGCKSKVETIKTEIDKSFEVQLISDLRPVVSTMEFYLYAVPENFWYPDGTSSREVMEDELKLGYKKLGKLDNIIGSIQTENSDITSAIDTLHNRIVIARKEIRKTQKAMDQVNSIFGFGLYGGMTGLYDFATLFGGSNTDDDDEVKMPKEVLEAFEGLKEAIRSANFQFLRSVQNFEKNVIGEKKIFADELLIIRLYIKQKIRDNVNLYYTGADTTDRNEATQGILDAYDTFLSLEN